MASPKATVARPTAAAAALASEAAVPFVSVAIRVKPPTDPSEQLAVWVKPGTQRICCHRGYLLEEHEFSRVIGPEDDNHSLYRDLQGPALAASVFGGVNETLFAYGQTGSGKTHTIFGSGKQPGLLPFFVTSIFEHSAQLAPGSTIHVCCYEVLGDSLTDLIDPQRLIDRGEVRLDDVVFDELFLKTQKCRYRIVRVDSASACLGLLEEARVNRTSGISSCNATSSRSHAVVHIFVQNPVPHGKKMIRTTQDGEAASIAALTLVDLAGAERECENPSEQGRKSTRILNTSLSSLNRLLRKLQTSSLDESERRQSVLNKCLWDYLRPGCGISLIFCISPLLKHRPLTLSTLAMATDSKLIRSRRKSQYVQPLPLFESSLSNAPPQPQAGARHTPRRPGFASATTPSTSRKEFGASTSTPVAARSSSNPAIARMRDLGQLTPRRVWGGGPGSAAAVCASPASSSSRSHAGTATVQGRAGGGKGRHVGQFGIDLAADAAYADDVHNLSASSGNLENSHSHGVHGIQLQNAKLRYKLGRARARSQERLNQATSEKEQLNVENEALRQECRSLRALFIRQQQQQIAFWTGPFMDMVAPKGACASSPQFGGAGGGGNDNARCDDAGTPPRGRCERRLRSPSKDGAGADFGLAFPQGDRGKEPDETCDAARNCKTWGEDGSSSERGCSHSVGSELSTSMNSGSGGHAARPSRQSESSSAQSWSDGVAGADLSSGGEANVTSPFGSDP